MTTLLKHRKGVLKTVLFIDIKKKMTILGTLCYVTVDLMEMHLSYKKIYQKIVSLNHLKL